MFKNKEFVNTVLRDIHLDMQNLQKENPYLARVVEEYSKKLSVNRKENWDGTVNGLDYRQFDEITAINDLLLITLIQNEDIQQLLNINNQYFQRLVDDMNVNHTELWKEIHKITELLEKQQATKDKNTSKPKKAEK